MGAGPSSRGANASSNGTHQLQPHTARREARNPEGPLSMASPSAARRSPAAAGRQRNQEGAVAAAETTATTAARPLVCPDDRGLFVAGEAYEQFVEDFLLIDFDPEQAAVSARTTQRIRASRTSSSDGSSSNSSTPCAEGDEPYARLCVARLQQQRLQGLKQETAETQKQMLQTKEDWEDLAEHFFGNLYVMSLSFWLPQKSTRRTDHDVDSADNSSGNGTSSGSSSSSSTTTTTTERVDSFPVDLASLRQFYGNIVAAARAMEKDGDWDPMTIVLKRVEELCGRLLKNSSSLRHPQQLAFVPVLLECPILEEEDVEFAALSKLCQVVAALPYSSRCVIASWYEVAPAADMEQHISVVQQFLSVQLLTAGPLETWHYPQCFPNPAETALRSSLQLLHVLYAANVRRQQRRQQLVHWRQQLLHGHSTVIAEGFNKTSTAPDGGPTQANEGHSPQKEHVREIDFAAFHNDAINSNPQLLQHEVALWLRLRRGAPLNSFTLQLPQHQQLHRRARGPLWMREQERQPQYQPAEGVRGEGRHAAAAAAAAAAQDANATAGSDTAPGSALRSMSVDSLFSAGAEAEAALRPVSGAEGEAAAAAAEDGAAFGDGYDNDDVFPISLLRLVAAAAELGGNSPLLFSGSPSPVRAAGVPNSVPASAAAAAAAVAANAPFCHSAVPEKSPEQFLFSLLQHPFVLDASSKADLLHKQALLEQQQQARQAEMDAIVALCSGGVGYSAPFLFLRVRRSHLVQDTLQQIACSSGSRSNNTNLRKALKVKFIGEEGVDQGGVAKEFFQLLVDELFSPDYAMFSLDEESQLHWFCGYSLEGRYRFELIGILCGLAIHNSVLMPVRFPLVLFKKLLGWPADSLEDLYELQPQVARSLCWVLQASPESVKNAGFTFSVSSNFLGEQREEALGSHKPSDIVTYANREEYVQLYIQHVLEVSVRDQYLAFEEGFYRCVDKSAISFFRPEELQLLLLGKEEELDVSLMQQAATYQDGYNKDSPAIAMFWSVCRDLTQEQKKKLLMFVTGSDRVPLGGLSSLKLTIGRSGPDTDRLPTAHTCFNFLLLPDYSSKEKMARLLAINQAAEELGP